MSSDLKRSGFTRFHSVWGDRERSWELLQWAIDQERPVLFDIHNHALVCCGYSDSHVWVVDNSGREALAIKGWPKEEWKRRHTGWVLVLTESRRAGCKPWRPYPRPSPNRPRPRPSPHIDPPPPDDHPDTKPPEKPSETKDERITQILVSIDLMKKDIIELKGRPALPGPPGPAGKDGKDGRSVDADALAKLIQELVVKHAKPGPAGKDGKDGMDGKDADNKEILALVVKLQKEVIVLRDLLDKKTTPQRQEGTIRIRVEPKKKTD